LAGDPREVTYRIRGDRVDAEVDGVPLPVLVRSATPDRVDMEIGGIRRVYHVHQVGADTYVDASDGSTTLSEIPRFGDPEKLAPAGSLLAPMPGLVLRVLAEPGTVVTAGQPILVLEAMKMEQTVSAPADGMVAELRAKAGEQVSTGQVLAVLEAGA
jgi:biotin carboxyl carrier protein